MRPLRERSSAELGKVASGSATQGLWLGDRKVGSQVIGEDRSRLFVRGTVGEIRRGARWEEKPTTEQKREYTDLGINLGEKEEQVACHASALTLVITDEACWEAEI